MNTISKDGWWYAVHKLIGTSEYHKLASKVWTIDESGNYVFKPNPQPVNLCPWFWKGLLGIISIGAVLAIMSALALLTMFVLTMYLIFVTGPVTGWWGWSPEYTAEMTAALLIIITCAVIFMCIEFAGGRVDFAPEYMKKPLRILASKVRGRVTEVPEVDVTESTKPKSPSALTQYIKARKDKWCPMLTLEEGDK